MEIDSVKIENGEKVIYFMKLEARKKTELEAEKAQLENKIAEINAILNSAGVK